ncbi:MAG: DUF4391 domain-containing protein [Ignavibacteriales bacterium]|nr:DUF4391 domain-containing protein [Ignavibacteriales bacterium]MCF8316460.1 DUF4391 domain-containing protein [Ignavibacteriales bacterium]MCF8437940.1 DUF4391 domain-containing protein [Ignavibacteriales bacterium]
MNYELGLPGKALVDKFIAKSKFYEKANLGSKIQNEFVNKVQRITWKYKLAEDTLGISKSENVTEIQIFELELKEQNIPKSVLKVIDRSIPYKILFVFRFKDSFAYGIGLKSNDAVENYYFSDWNQSISFDFNGTNLEKVYQKLVKAFLPEEIQKKNDFEEAITLDAKIKELEKDIILLENRIRKEKQFNRKVDTNKTLLQKKKELNSLKRKLI